ncbi:uncharacterized protein LOC132639415 [Lycium barbarum]|uniref:uncharacterized protein LOC132639415 n=1 Tax=Lycium barbarum TaxID=112863 RepID=UPI00293E7C17|nr:uncharacterized protein LOC132639415 [Lycium barbarum]
MLEKVLGNQDKADRTLKGLTETVGSHTASIQKLEWQMRDISREQHPPQKGGLPSDTILNPKNGEGGLDRVYAINTRSGKIIQSAEKKVINLEPVAEEEEAQYDLPTIVDEVQIEVPIIKQVDDVPESFEKQKYSHDTRKSMISMNIPFIDAIKEMPRFSKYLKDLLTKKRSVKHETMSVTHRVSSIISITNVQKKEDLGAFTFPFLVGQHDFARALCGNGASINLMPLAIYKKSGLGMPSPTTMRLQMADNSIKRLLGMVDAVLVRVGDFLLPANFVILDYAVDRDIPIILARHFLAAGRAFMDLEKNEIKFRVNDKEVNFQHPKKLDLDLENRTTPLAKPSIVDLPKLELKQLPAHLKYEIIGPANILQVIVFALLNKE